MAYEAFCAPLREAVARGDIKALLGACSLALSECTQDRAFAAELALHAAEARLSISLGILARLLPDDDYFVQTEAAYSLLQLPTRARSLKWATVAPLVQDFLPHY